MPANSLGQFRTTRLILWNPTDYELGLRVPNESRATICLLAKRHSNMPDSDPFYSLWLAVKICGISFFSDNLQPFLQKI